MLHFRLCIFTWLMSDTFTQLSSLKSENSMGSFSSFVSTRRDSETARRWQTISHDKWQLIQEAIKTNGWMAEGIWASLTNQSCSDFSNHPNRKTCVAAAQRTLLPSRLLWLLVQHSVICRDWCVTLGRRGDEARTHRWLSFGRREKAKAIGLTWAETRLTTILSPVLQT